MTNLMNFFFQIPISLYSAIAAIASSIVAISQFLYLRNKEIDSFILKNNKEIIDIYILNGSNQIISKPNEIEDIEFRAAFKNEVKDINFLKIINLSEKYVFLFNAKYSFKKNKNYKHLFANKKKNKLLSNSNLYIEELNNSLDKFSSKKDFILKSNNDLISVLASIYYESKAFKNNYSIDLILEVNIQYLKYGLFNKKIVTKIIKNTICFTVENNKLNIEMSNSII
ncbi:hypothetical protein SKB0068_14340 [Staphylococcus hominis subsp. novobiosepticus]|uniref:hypothetical protein n=1 Tax=Staphylococcus hominis TaxID=1290 RepID=UPI00324984AD